MIRPRFQFRLRTFLLAVTLVATASGLLLRHDTDIVARRAQWLQSHANMSLERFGRYETVAIGDHNLSPWILRLCLGDRPYKTIGVREDISGDDIKEGEALFPEATILRWVGVKRHPPI